MTRSSQGRVPALAVGSAVAVSVLLAACGGGALGADAPGSGASAPPTVSAAPAEPTPVPSATPARTAASERTRFRPVTLVLPGGVVVPIVVARTAKGVLTIPENVHQAGWWDGSAYINDPYGSTVLAGHVDSAEQGIGAFATLLKARKGAVITVKGKTGQAATYTVVSVNQVDKDALVATSGAFDQQGSPRLVLITCTGRFDPVRRSYDQNLVVTAVPVASAG